MTLYRYQALSTTGEPLTGQMEAASAAEVIARLQEQGHLPVEARPALAGEGGGLPSRFRKREASLVRSGRWDWRVTFMAERWG